MRGVCHRDQILLVKISYFWIIIFGPISYQPGDLIFIFDFLTQSFTNQEILFPYLNFRFDFYRSGDFIFVLKFLIRFSPIKKSYLCICFLTQSFIDQKILSPYLNFRFDFHRSEDLISTIKFGSVVHQSGDLISIFYLKTFRTGVVAIWNKCITPQEHEN